MTEPLTESTPRPDLSTKDRLQAVARDILTAGEDIIQQRGLSRQPQGANFSWILYGDSSTNAQNLKKLIENPRDDTNFGLMLEGCRDTASVSDLTMDILTRLGFLKPGEELDPKKLGINGRDRAFTLPNTERGLDAVCVITGGDRGKPTIGGFRLVPQKTA